MGRPKGSLGPTEYLFWQKVDCRGFDDCWPWTANVGGSSGVKHGRFWVPAGILDAGRGRMYPAHCVAFRLIYGHWPDPQGLHGCDNGICCNALNPMHVHEGSQQQNIREMFDRGRARPRGVVPLDSEERRGLFLDFERSGMTRPAFAESRGMLLTTLNPIIWEGRSGRLVEA